MAIHEVEAQRVLILHLYLILSICMSYYQEGCNVDSFDNVSMLKPNLPSAIMRETLITTHPPDGFGAYFQLEWMLL
jgi:hypothetical protein